MCVQLNQILWTCGCRARWCSCSCPRRGGRRTACRAASSSLRASHSNSPCTSEPMCRPATAATALCCRGRGRGGAEGEEVAGTQGPRAAPAGRRCSGRTAVRSWCGAPATASSPPPAPAHPAAASAWSAVVSIRARSASAPQHWRLRLAVIARSQWQQQWRKPPASAQTDWRPGIRPLRTHTPTRAGRPPAARRRTAALPRAVA